MRIMRKVGSPESKSENDWSCEKTVVAVQRPNLHIM